MICPHCSIENASQAMFCQSCGKPLGGAITYGGFWKRFAALIIDAIVVSVGIGIITALTFGVATPPLALFAPWIYEAWMLSSPWQATIGKRAFSMVVTGIHGDRISFARATGRHFAKYLSAIFLGIGFIMAAFTTRKQGLHDLLAETLVIEKPGNLP
jgi:uncharacterized RDD family membrane protein YckC